MPDRCCLASQRQVEQESDGRCSGEGDARIRGTGEVVGNDVHPGALTMNKYDRILG